MSICLATKGMICPAPLIIPQRNPFTPILDFDVELVLDKPIGLYAQNLDVLDKPNIFRVEEIQDLVDKPKGFMVEGDEEMSTPSGLQVTDEEFVSAPTGFAVEEL